MKKHKIHDILKINFIIISFFILIMPVLRINKGNISILENREFALYKPLYNKENKIFNHNYGKDFEVWLKDRFLGRIYFINLYTTLKFFSPGRFVRTNNVIIDKENNFMYQYVISDMYNINELGEVSNELSNFNEYCKRRNIKLYVVIIPQKETIYTSGLTSFDVVNYVRSNVDIIAMNKNINLIFPLDNFLYAKQVSPYLLFHKTDSHATMEGAFIGYYALMKKIKKDFPNLVISQDSDYNYFFSKKVKTNENREFTNGETCRIFGLPNIVCKKLLDVDYKYYEHKLHKDLYIKNMFTDDIRKIKYYYPKGFNKKVLIFGDSFSENLMDIFPYSFRYTTKIRLNGPKNIPDKKERFKILKYYETEIDALNPDIVIIYVCYRESLGKLKYINMRK